jgi:F0F1-type ATP synthase assembly protein I
MPDDRASGEKRQGTEFAEATLWVSRITSTIAPGLLGLWLDDRFGTRYWALIGLVLGLTSGTLHMVQYSKGVFKKPVRRPPDGPPPEQRDRP